MSDLISTQEAVAKIVDTAIQKILSGEQKLTKEYEQTVIDAVNVILNTARCEIVRCKGCKYHTHMWYCEAWNNSPGFPAVSDDMFCSLAERRTDEHDDIFE